MSQFSICVPFKGPPIIPLKGLLCLFINVWACCMNSPLFFPSGWLLSWPLRFSGTRSSLPSRHCRCRDASHRSTLSPSPSGRCSQKEHACHARPIGPGPPGPWARCGPMGPKWMSLFFTKAQFFEKTFFEEIDIFYDHPAPKPGRK